MSTLSRVKAAITSSDPANSHPYECKTCGARFSRQHQVCPECGGYTLDRIDWSSESIDEK
jgi:rRNA maturation endonuclease Nob1